MTWNKASNPAATPMDDPTGYRPYPRKARDEGSELRLARWAQVYQIIGWIFLALTALCVLLLMWNFSDFTYLEVDLTNYVFFRLGVMCLLVSLPAFFFSALLHGAADVVRLLKRSNNLPYSGEISL